MKTINFFDLETTGVNPSTDRIVQICIVKTDINLNILDKKNLMFNPLIPIPKEATNAHGITDEMVKDKPTFTQYAGKIFEYFGTSDYLAGFNSKQFDTPLLYEEFARCGLIWTPKPQIDCSVIFKRHEERTLQAAHKFYCGTNFDGAHDAEADVLATINVLAGQTYKYGLDNILGEFETEDFGFLARPIEEIWVKESFYEGEDKRVDLAGKIVLNDENIPVWNFGKNKGNPVKSDLNYCDWVVNGVNDISSNVKNIVKSIIS